MKCFRDVTWFLECWCYKNKNPKIVDLGFIKKVYEKFFEIMVQIMEWHWEIECTNKKVGFYLCKKYLINTVLKKKINFVLYNL